MPKKEKEKKIVIAWLCPLLPPLARERGRVNTREGHLAKGHKGTLLRRGVCWCFLLVHKLMLRYTVTKYYHFEFLLSGLPSLLGLKFYSGICYRGGCTAKIESLTTLLTRHGWGEYPEIVLSYWILNTSNVFCNMLCYYTYKYSEYFHIDLQYMIKTLVQTDN